MQYDPLNHVFWTHPLSYGSMNHLTFTIVCFPPDGQFLIRIVSKLALYYASTYHLISYHYLEDRPLFKYKKCIIESNFR